MQLPQIKALHRMMLILEFPKIGGTLFWGPYNEDPTIWGTRLGSPIFGNSHIGQSGLLLIRHARELGGSCDLVSYWGYKKVISIVTSLRTLLTKSHEPPSRP